MKLLFGARAAARLVLLVLFLGGWAHAAIWKLTPGDPGQPGSERAAAGDTITLVRGHYAGGLRVDKPLTLRGLDRPTLDGGRIGDVIRITAPGVTVEGL